MKDQITHKIKKNHAKGTEISGIQKKLIADISRMVRMTEQLSSADKGQVTN